ncbi:hypothetical protein DERF_005009 [Dermatophagoides farinae]|uniref:BTB domain-containing protein n=1 Tax=Dermatophagoides farinae TaxID=6954 RepID=A0A922I341_DERFA|nr:hypothetical protein DERF_005009 [Dermatophagoides farinae]
MANQNSNSSDLDGGSADGGVTTMESIETGDTGDVRINSYYQIIRLNHQDRMSSAFESMLCDEMFCDVTIICNGQAVKAHRVILATASSYFKEIFQHIPFGFCPIVFLKNFTNEDLNNILEFIYKGILVIPSDRIQSLIDSAKSLGIVGLATLQMNIIDNNQNNGNLSIIKDITQNDDDNNNDYNNIVNDKNIDISSSSATINQNNSNTTNNNNNKLHTGCKKRGRKRKLPISNDNNKPVVVNNNNSNDDLSTTTITTIVTNPVKPINDNDNNQFNNGSKIHKSFSSTTTNHQSNGLNQNLNDIKISDKPIIESITSSSSSSPPSLSSLSSSSSSSSPPKSNGLDNRNDKCNVNHTQLKTVNNLQKSIITNEKSIVSSSSSTTTAAAAAANDDSTSNGNKSSGLLLGGKLLRNRNSQQSTTEKKSSISDNNCDQHQHHDGQISDNKNNNNSNNSSTSNTKNNKITKSKLQSWSQQIWQKHLATLRSSTKNTNVLPSCGSSSSADSVDHDQSSNDNQNVVGVGSIISETTFKANDTKILKTTPANVDIKYEIPEGNLIRVEPRRGRPPKIKQTSTSFTTIQNQQVPRLSPLVLSTKSTKKLINGTANGHNGAVNGNSKAVGQQKSIKRGRGRPPLIKQDPYLRDGALSDTKFLSNIEKSSSFTAASNTLTDVAATIVVPVQCSTSSLMTTNNNDNLNMKTIIPKQENIDDDDGGDDNELTIANGTANIIDNNPKKTTTTLEMTTNNSISSTTNHATIST